MRVHLDVLGWLHVLVGATGICSGLALGILALGTALSLPADGAVGARLGNPVVFLLVVAGASFIVGGGLMVGVGRSLGRRQAAGRRAALLTALPTLVLLPFGTALGIYTFWTLLNDEARLEFGRPPRAPA
jgi:hypothetical protein